MSTHTTTSTEEIVLLPGTGTPPLQAVLTCARHGQQYPYEGDGVIVLATLALPADTPNNHAIARCLRFESRIPAVMGEHLACWWGSPLSTHPGCACRTSAHIAPTWPEAFALAHDHLSAELSKLTDALRARAAYAAADAPTCPAASPAPQPPRRRAVGNPVPLPLPPPRSRDAPRPRAPHRRRARPQRP